MASAGGNEVAFRKEFEERFGNNVLLGKQRFKSHDESIEVNSDNSFDSKNGLVLVEIDSGNAAKLLLGEYILFNELPIGKPDMPICLLIVHFYKGYNASRTQRVLSHANEVLYADLGMPFAAINWKELKEALGATNTIDELHDKLFSGHFVEPRTRALLEVIRRNDRQDIPGRLERLKWLVTVISSEWSAFHGGEDTLYIFEEMRHSYLLGNFIASIILGFSLIEHTLAAVLYARGHNEAAGIGFAQIVRLLTQDHSLSAEISEAILSLSSIRNRIAHFRIPVSEEKAEIMRLRSGMSLQEMWDLDAKQVIVTATTVLQRFTNGF
jgi:hypothetical protein